MSNPNIHSNLQTQTSNSLHNAIMEAGGKDRLPMLASGNYNPPYIFKWTKKPVPVSEAVQKPLQKGIDNDIYSTVDACLNTCEMWKSIKRFYKMMNELVRNKCDVTNHQVNVQFLLQLQPKWQRFVMLVKQSQGLKTVSYHKLYDILKQHQNEVNEIRTDRLARTAILLALKIYKPTNNNIRNSSNINRANQDNTPKIDRGTGYDNQRAMNVVGARANVGTQNPKRAKDAAYHWEKMLLCKQEEAGFQLNVSPDAAENSRTVFDEPLQKVDHDDDDDDLASKHDFLASLIERLKCEIDGSKNRNKFLESSNKTLVDKLKGEIEDFKNKNKSLESSNNHFKEANNELSKTNQMMFKDIKKFQDELDRYHDVNYASKVELDCAKAKGDLMSYKMSSEKSFNEYTRKINDLNQTISDMKQELVAHQEKLSIISHEKETQKQFYKTREDKEIEKIIALENKVKVLDDIVYKTGQSVQTMNMLNRNCKTNFVKPKFLKKAQRANPCLYDIGCYNDNLALMLAPESDESIRLAQESRSKLSDLIKPFDYEQLNNLYDLFVPQREKSAEQQFF
ncbi:hypothetical protein Tco_0845142 [Tanacetum coccineum]